MAAQGYPVKAVENLPDACARADIISTATMSNEPVIFGDWITAGTHVDLIGAFKANMREADDALMNKARLFVDSYDTTLLHIGELMMPLASGVISKADVLADYRGLVAGDDGRLSEDDITVLKNGGGAHLDLMTAKYILSRIA
jgi:ornithine cyclodeaminase